MAQKILLLTTEMRPGGAERIVHDLALSLSRDRYTPIVAALDGRGEYAERIRAGGIEVHDLRAYSRFDLPVIWRLRRLLREQKIDLLHTHLIHASIVGRLAARPLGIPVVSTSHIVDRRPVAWHFWLDGLTARWCRKEICVSQAVQQFQQSRKGLPDDYYTVIPNGIDLECFSNLPEKTTIRRRLTLPETGLVVGALGRFDRQKGLDILLAAAAHESLREENFTLVLAGYGREEDALRQQAESLDIAEQTIFAGYQESAETYLPALDIVAVPSRWEGFGLVAAEAMACGCAVVASRVDSIPEIITHEEDGLLVPPENPAALAAGIKRLIRDSDFRTMLGSQARESVRRFSRTAMTAAHETLYDTLLTETKHHGKQS